LQVLEEFSDDMTVSFRIQLDPALNGWAIIMQSIEMDVVFILQPWSIRFSGPQVSNPGISAKG
jgi:hypothetical protein